MKQLVYVGLDALPSPVSGAHVARDIDGDARVIRSIGSDEAFNPHDGVIGKRPARSQVFSREGDHWRANLEGLSRGGAARRGERVEHNIRQDVQSHEAMMRLYGYKVHAC